MKRREDEEAVRSPETDRVDALLDELNEGDPPPPDLVRDVMASVRTIRTQGIHRGIGGTVMAKKILIGMSAAAAVFLAVFTKTGWPFVD